MNLPAWFAWVSQSPLDHAEPAWEKTEGLRTKLDKGSHDLPNQCQTATRASMIEFQPVVRNSTRRKPHENAQDVVEYRGRPGATGLNQKRVKDPNWTRQRGSSRHPGPALEGLRFGS